MLLGTRFIATRESAVPEFRKKAVLEAESDATTLTQSVTGLWARYTRNTFVREYDASGAPVLPALVQNHAAADIFREAGRRQDADWLPMATGQSAGMIHDLPGAGEVVAAIVREARSVLDALAGIRLHRAAVRCLGLTRRRRGRGSRSDDARAAGRRGATATDGNPDAPGQHWTRTLLASPGSLGSPTREDRSAADGAYLAGVSAGAAVYCQ